MSSEIQTPLSILCEWAWAKVNLEDLQSQGNAAQVGPGIVAYRRALRKKKKLDAEYREHHTAMAELEEARMKLLKLLASRIVR